MNRFKYLMILPMILLAFHSVAKPESNKAEDTGKVIVLDKADFLTKVFNYEKNSSEWIYEGQKPCIIDFYADWCIPCRRVAPVLKELAAEYKDDIVIYKINVDKEKELATVFGVSSIPMLLFVPMEGKPQASMGVQPKETLEKQIKEFLLKKNM